MMKHFIRHSVACGILVLGLAACQSFTPQQNLAATCASTSAVIKVLTKGYEDGKISQAAHEEQGVYIHKVQKVCGHKPEPSFAEVQKEAFDEAVAYLAAKAGKL